MKTNLLIAAMALVVLTPALAQYQSIGTDGIAASPKYRQLLDARQTSTAAVATSVTFAQPVILGSPKSMETWNKPTVATPPVATRNLALQGNCTGTRTVASPKMQAMLPKAAANQCCGMTSCVMACAR